MTCLLLNSLKYTNIIIFNKIKLLRVSNVNVNYFSNKSKILLDVNTNVSKDVIMYQHENIRFMRILSTFAIIQYTFWSYLSYLSYATLKDTPVDVKKLTPKSPWYMKVNLGEPKYRYGISSFCGFIALTILFSTYGFTVRMVRYLVLHKGGSQVSFVTYTPFGVNKILKVPIRDVSCLQARNAAKAFIPLKVKNKRMNYLVDTKGSFRNPLLFDNTVGLNRNLK